MVGLISPLALQQTERGVESEFTLSEGESVTIVLNYDESGADPMSLESDGPTVLKETIEYWHDWLSRCTYQGRWREMVYRSALTLKMLTFDPIPPP